MNLSKDLDEYIQLYLYGELGEKESKELEAHLEINSDSREKLKEWQEFHGLLDEAQSSGPSDAALQQARLALRERLRVERQAQHTGAIRRWAPFSLRMGPWRQFGTAAAFILFGVLLGGFWPRQSEQPAPPANIVDATLADEAFISDVDLIEYEPKSGIVKVHYKVVQGIAVEGSMASQQIRDVLSHAIRTGSNPGRRLTAIKASGGSIFNDRELETALIFALEKDEIDGVRLRAAQALRRQPISEKTKQAFVRRLMKDPNPAIRIEALEALSALRELEVTSILQNAAQGDENEYVRLTASRALERTENPGRVSRIVE